MKRLWAPWRMQYIECMVEPKGCFICEALKDRSRDRDNLLLWADDHAVCIMNRFPYNNGHLMVAPARHEGELERLTDDERAAIFAGIVRAKGLLEKVCTPHGYNVGMNMGRVAGAGLADHLHVHIVPRWEGDTNFMPILGDTKVIPQGLADLYDKLKEAMGE